MPNTSPQITSSLDTTFITSQTNSLLVTTTGTPPPTVSESGSLPSGITFNTTSSILSGNPAIGVIGNYPIQFTATNGIGNSAVQNFTLRVRPPEGSLVFTMRDNSQVSMLANMGSGRDALLSVIDSKGFFADNGDYYTLSAVLRVKVY